MRRIIIAAALALSFAAMPASAEDAVEPICECRNPDGQAGNKRQGTDGETYLCFPVAGGIESLRGWRFSCLWVQVPREDAE